MDYKGSFEDLGQEFTEDMNIDEEVSSINSQMYTPSHYHSPTYTTRILLATPPPPTVYRPRLDRFVTTRKSPTNLPTQERPPLDRFATTSPSNLSSFPILAPDRFATTSQSSLSSLPPLPPPMDHLAVTSLTEDTTKQNIKKTGDGVLRKNIKSYVGGRKTRRLKRYNKRTLTKDEEELDEMECIARYPYNDKSVERMKHCLKN
jgi:hypothetical protein